MRFLRFSIAALAAFLLSIFSLTALAAPTKDRVRQHLVFLQGTDQELEVYKIPGRFDGPTVMILGGIHGNEPGAYLSADLYADVTLKRGNLIVVPRTNFKSIIHNHRGQDGDMNRKFGECKPGDPEYEVIEIVKSLMAESDYLITLHDGSGFYRPKWESDLANPRRYGQCVIADANVYAHKPTGRIINLEKYALEAIAEVNKEIETPLHKFHFFNMETASSTTQHKEHRTSATYYALTELGIPAFCIETSKQLPSVDRKVYQHNLAINAFLERFGVAFEQPSMPASAPSFCYALVSVDNAQPVAVAEGHTLMVPAGAVLTVLHVASNMTRGFSVEFEGRSGYNNIQKPLRIEKDTALIIRRDNRVLGKIPVVLLPDGGSQPRLVGEGNFTPFTTAIPATLDMLPGTHLLAEMRKAAQHPLMDTPPTTGTQVATVGTGQGGNGGGGQPSSAGGQPGASTQAGVSTGIPAQPASVATGTQPYVAPRGGEKPVEGTLGEQPPSGSNAITAFLLEVDGKPVSLKPGEQATIMRGAHVKIVAMTSEGTSLPRGVVMNLKGFIANGSDSGNKGEDRGGVADTTKLMPAFSREKKGEVYDINAEVGKEVLATCSLKVVEPKLDFVTVRFNGETKKLRMGSRTGIPVGAKVSLVDVTMQGGLVLPNPRYTLAGHLVSSKLPQSLTMREIAINLAIFNGEALMGKVTWVPK